MAGTDITSIVGRVTSILTAPTFGFTRSVVPDTFDHQPTTNIDGVFTIVAKSQRTNGLMGLHDTRVDRITVRLARKLVSDQYETRKGMRNTANSIHAAVVRDGALLGGDYAVLDDWTWQDKAPVTGAEFGELEVQIPVDYETDL